MKKKLFLLAAALLLAGICYFLLTADHSARLRKVAVLGKADSDEALIVFLDKDDKVYKEIKIDYPEEVDFCEDNLFYTADERNYYSYSYKNFRRTQIASDYSGYVLYYQTGGVVFCYEDDSIVIYDKDFRKVTDLEIADIDGSRGVNGMYFVWDISGNVKGFDATDGSLRFFDNLMTNGYLNTVGIDDKTYFITNSGYTLFENNAFSQTYVYPRDVSDILGAEGRYIECVSDGRETVYRISFDSHRMIMEEMTEAHYYDEVDFEKFLSDYFARGYEVLDYWENFYGL